MNLFDPLLDLVFPNLCPGCEREVATDEGICAACRRHIPRYEFLRCGSCHARLPGGKKVCHKTMAYTLTAVTTYTHPTVSRAIRELKFHGRYPLAKCFGTLLASHITTVLPESSSMVTLPVPLHPKRERERGFNQAALLAREVSCTLKIPYLKNCLARTRASLPQTLLPSRADRQENVAHAFVVKNNRDIAGKHILLIDDVSTTGATLQEAARALKSAGACSVVGAVVAVA